VHGVIFTSFRDFLDAEHGPRVRALAFAGEPLYLLSDAYPDERLAALLEKAAAATGRDTGDLLEDFGVFAAERTFTRLYPAFFAVSGSTREFLLTVETRIHELVRATIAHAAPPQLTVSELGADSVQIVYTSPRRLCRLLRGLAEGTARTYGERTEIVESACMLHGDDACIFELTISPSA
jgi:hypothetical protein